MERNPDKYQNGGYVARHLSKDEDVRFYMNRGVEISYNNLREYQI